MEITAEQILALVNNKSRELSSRENTFFDTNPREVLKDKKIKRLNDISRAGEEMSGNKVSDETCPLALQPIGTSLALSPLQEEVNEEGLVSAEPARTTSRDMTAVTAQHVRTERGVKVNITLQTARQAQEGCYVSLTAELKRSDRIRELKPYAADNEEFAEFYELAKQMTREDTNKKNICIGRLHERGKRNKWIADMLVVGYLKDNVLDSIKFFFDGATYDIRMDHLMSERQQRLYHCSGIWGQLQTKKAAPTFETLPVNKF